MRFPLKPAFRLLAVLSVLAATPLSGSAQLLYTNGVPDNLNGYPVSGQYVTANDFPLLSSTQLGSFDWYVFRWGTGGPATISSSFSWGIHTDAGGTVGSNIGGGAVSFATGTKTLFFCCAPYSGYETYLFSGISFGGLSLGMGQYWLAISSYVNADNNFGYWSTSLQAGNQQFFNGYWQQYNAEGAFSIYGLESQVVPEPASITLFGAGLVGLYGFVHRRRRGTSGKSLLGSGGFVRSAMQSELRG